MYRLPVVFMGIAGLLMLTQATIAENSTRIGRWCDIVGAAWKQEIAFIRTDSGINVKYSNHSTSYTKTLDIKNGIYVVRNSDFGEYFKIIHSGDLQLLDKDGPIRIARKGECP